MLFFVLAGMISSTLAIDVISPPDPRDGWKFAHKSKDVMIYSRDRSGSAIKEFKAIGSIDGSTSSVHAVLDDVDNYPKFMPFVVEATVIRKEGDSTIGYQRISPKILSDRDYTLRIWKKSWPAEGGTAFLDKWVQANDQGPAEKKGVVRVKVCDGSWLLEPDNGQTRATYSVYTDSGGNVPAFLANQASQSSIIRVFEAIRKQVKARKG